MGVRCRHNCTSLFLFLMADGPVRRAPRARAEEPESSDDAARIQHPFKALSWRWWLVPCGIVLLIGASQGYRLSLPSTGRLLAAIVGGLSLSSCFSRRCSLTRPQHFRLYARHCFGNHGAAEDQVLAQPRETRRASDHCSHFDRNSWLCLAIVLVDIRAMCLSWPWTGIKKSRTCVCVCVCALLIFLKACLVTN